MPLSARLTLSALAALLAAGAACELWRLLALAPSPSGEPASLADELAFHAALSRWRSLSLGALLACGLALGVRSLTL